MHRAAPCHLCTHATAALDMQIFGYMQMAWLALWQAVLAFQLDSCAMWLTAVHAINAMGVPRVTLAFPCMNRTDRLQVGYKAFRLQASPELPCLMQQVISIRLMIAGSCLRECWQMFYRLCELWRCAIMQDHCCYVLSYHLHTLTLLRSHYCMQWVGAACYFDAA